MRILIAFAAVASLAACAPQGQRPNAVPQSANPSSVIAAEIAFNRLAQEKGQWTAFRQTAAKDATMFVPEPVDAQTWLKGRKDPARSALWQPHRVYMSCDGKTGVSTGAWQKADGTFGYFTTVWQWMDKGRVDPNLPPNAMTDGTWKWVVDHADTLPTPLLVPEMIETKVASCKGRPGASINAPAEGSKMKMGLSRDQSLNFTWVVNKDNSRTLEVGVWNGDDFESVLLNKVAAPKPS